MEISKKKKSKEVFIEGAISPEFISQSISKHQSKTEIGAHNIFLGQVREDIINGRKVKAIEYSAYPEMAEKEFYKIREAAFSKFDLICLHIYHSIGRVKAGEVSLFVFVSSKHRDDSYKTSRYIVEAIKSKVPIFGKEVFKNDSYTWKENH